MNNQLFNSRVSIITKSEIRYEGTLFQVNPQQQNLALKDVRSFGTEGRRPGNFINIANIQDHEIPAVSHTYDVIVFKASEIKELKVIQPEVAAQQPPQQNMPPPQLQKEEVKQEEVKQAPVQQEQQPKNMYGTSRLFDFDEMMSKITQFEKDKSQQESVAPKYKKSDFFDNMSNSINSKQNGPRQMTMEERQNENYLKNIQFRQHQNQVDTDTFGNFYKQNPNKKYYNNRRRNNNNNYDSRRNNNNNNRRQHERVMYVEKKHNDAPIEDQFNK